MTSRVPPGVPGTDAAWAKMIAFAAAAVVSAASVSRGRKDDAADSRVPELGPGPAEVDAAAAAA